jgi:hypothetical protein
MKEVFERLTDTQMILIVLFIFILTLVAAFIRNVETVKI